MKRGAAWLAGLPARVLNQFRGGKAAWAHSLADSLALNRLRLQLALAKLAGDKGRGAGARKKRIIHISGEPGMAGHHYRVELYVQALAARGYDAQAIPVGKAKRLLPLIETADAVVIWRAEWSKTIRTVVEAVRRKRGKLIFDLDDLVMDPAVAKIEIVDGLRTNGFTEQQAAAFYGRIQSTLLAADFCTASTEFLASAMRRFGKPVFVLPNGFDEQTHRETRAALEKRRAAPSDGLIRLGYAGGSRTHQKDFAQAASSLARILRAHPRCRLVLFQERAAAGQPRRCIDLSEFPEFSGLAEQIEWRDTVPFRRLPDELVRFDINLAPVEIGNVFCEAKSELKYFEAALAEVPTIASPTDPFSRAIKSGETGFLAASAEEWESCLERLIIDANLRTQIGRAAYADVPGKYGPERRADLQESIMRQILARCRASVPSLTRGLAIRG